MNIQKTLKFIRCPNMPLSLISIFLTIYMFLIPQFVYSQQQYSFLSNWGSRGTADGQFITPSGIAIDSSDNVYVADVLNHRIQKFSSDGKFLTKWGSRGTADGQFLGPSGIAIDPSGNVYVADRIENRIQKFSSDGKFLTKWGSSCQIGNPPDPHCNKKSMGALEAGDGQFNQPQGITLDSSSNVYVADSMNGRIQKFNNSGAFLTKWDTAAGEPRGIVIDRSGKIYVSIVSRNDSISVYDNMGIFLTKWGSSCVIKTGFGCKSVLGLKTSQLGDGQFNVPTGLSLDSMGRLYVSDTNNNRIEVFNNSGAFLTKWGSVGIGEGQFHDPQGIAVNTRSYQLYITDSGNDRIQVFEKPNKKDF
jgi:tripartite motif-containing protein 71